MRLERRLVSLGREFFSEIFYVYVNIYVKLTKNRLINSWKKVEKMISLHKTGHKIFLLPTAA